MTFSRGSSPPRHGPPVYSVLAGEGILYHEGYPEANKAVITTNFPVPSIFQYSQPPFIVMFPCYR